MLKQRRMVAEQIAGALFDAEAAIDTALSKTAMLTGVMPALRRQAGASVLIGQDAMERASQAIVVAHRTQAFRDALGQTRSDQVVFDLVRLPDPGTIPARYVGLYWPQPRESAATAPVEVLVPSLVKHPG